MMTIMRGSRMLVLCCPVLVGACTSVSSRVVESARPVEDGIAYYMPSRPIKITVTVDKDGNQSAAVTPADTVPDTRRRFVLNYDRNWVGKNHLVVGVTSTGLLTSSNADTVSGVVTIAKNLAQAAGTVSALGLAGPGPAKAAPTQRPRCKPNQTYVELITPGLDTIKPLCDYSMKVELLGPAASPGNNTLRLQDINVSQSGLFYKQDLPYKVTLENPNNGDQSQYLAFSPSESPVLFFPVTRTFFANNNANVTFTTPGTISNADESSDGELVAASALPAEVLSAYFDAIGHLFSQFSTNAQNQTAELNNLQALSVARIKQQACAAVIATNPIAGKTTADVEAAVASIKAACT